jgi:hypothetical protein
MLMRPSRRDRLAAGIGVCVVLALLVPSCAGDAISGGAGPHFTGERMGALEPAAVPTDAAPAAAGEDTSLPATGHEVAQPADEETAASTVPDPGSSPAPSSSEPPAEDHEPASTASTGDAEDAESSADPDSGAPLTEDPSKSQGEATTETDEQPPDDTTLETQPADDTTPETDNTTPETDNQPDDTTTETDDEAPDDTTPETQPPDDTTTETDDEAPDDTTTETDDEAPDDTTPEPETEQVGGGEGLPGDGPLFPESDDEGPTRRMVAIYGHPSTGGLGVLGEQGPDEAVERLRSIAEGYGADGSVVLPTFEIIATVASAAAGADGDYSGMTDRDVIRPWIEVAAANGVYVVLDLQPGRTDFLTQAKYYEEFLRLPHVGLALDPEWRLKPDQVHLEQIGTVDAAEINRVVDWLAGIVREEALPQKLLIVHQFRLAMITNREQIKTPPELAVLIHMDGQGSLTAKYNTWNTLTGRADAHRFHWGWKNFYDEDSPMAAPEQVLELSPQIVFVSFQ